MSYTELQPQEIREEFACFSEDISNEYILRALANYVSTDTLADFMDDLVHERI